MKIIEKISLTIFSVLILVLSLVLSLILFNWVDTTNVYLVIQFLKSTQTLTNISLVVSIILMLLAIKCIFFSTYKDEEESAEGILLENESGKLLISIDTIENLVKGVVAQFQSVKSTNCKVKLNRQVNNVIININLVVLPETIIKDLSVNLQTKIKEVIKSVCFIPR